MIEPKKSNSFADFIIPDEMMKNEIRNSTVYESVKLMFLKKFTIYLHK